MPEYLIAFLKFIQGESLATGPKLLSIYAVEHRGFLVLKYWQTGSFKACQTAFRTEFDKRRAPSKCCAQKLVKSLETRGSRSNACRLLFLVPIEGQSVQKYTPHNRTTQRRYTPRDSSRQYRHFGKSIPEFGETHSSVLGCERRRVSASIMSRSCFASFPVCVYKFSSNYLNNIIFLDNSLRPLARDSTCSIAQCIVFGRWRSQRRWRAGVLSVVKWRVVGVYSLGTSG